jgi:hypothetical protein
LRTVNLPTGFKSVIRNFKKIKIIIFFLFKIFFSSV